MTYIFLLLPVIFSRKYHQFYLIKSLLQNRAEESSISILLNGRKAIQKNEKLLFIKRLIHAGNKKFEAKLFDINMLVKTGGQDPTAEEYKKLLNTAGFNLTQVLSIQCPVSILECLRTV